MLKEDRVVDFRWFEKEVGPEHHRKEVVRTLQVRYEKQDRGQRTGDWGEWQDVRIEREKPMP